MLIAIHQPEHLPWVGFFEKMLRADIFVVLDNVQFSKGDFQNRNRVKGPGGAQWLTVPVVHKFSQKINEVKVVDNNNWRAKHWKTLVSCYGRATHFDRFATMFENFYSQSWVNLADLNVAALELIARAFGIEKKWVFASELAAGGQKSELVLNICKMLGASSYYSGRAGSTYLDKEAFRRASIEIIVQNFEHPTYEQLFMKEQGFIPSLSALDMLFNCGPQSIDLLHGAVNRAGICMPFAGIRSSDVKAAS